MTIFNLETNRFETYNAYNKITKFLAIQIDRDREDFKEVIHYFHKEAGINSYVALNNENDDNLEIALELFSNEDVRFALYLDFYRHDNTLSLLKILKTIE